VKLLADIDDTVQSPPLTAPATVAVAYRKRIQTIAMSCLNVHMRYTDVLKLYHMSLHVQYSTVMSAGHTQQHSVSQCCLTAMYRYNEYIITANNVCISCKVNSCLPSHWCVLTFIKITFSENCLENIDINTKVTTVSFKQLGSLYMYICAFTSDVLLLCTFYDIYNSKFQTAGYSI
jgi:hypothetical protein